MVTKNLFVIFRHSLFVILFRRLLVSLLFSLFLASCAQIPKVNFRNTEKKIEKERAEQQAPQRSVPFGQEENQEEADEESGDHKEPISFETREQQKPFRPKIGLVLGPGLSRTFAHIGVLKELKAARIPVHSIIGMGWASIVAAEYVDQKSVHGLEWKVSRSEKLKQLSAKSFWSSSIKEKNTAEAEALVVSLLTSYGAKASRRGEFSCPLLSQRRRALVFSDKRGLKNCISVPPLFNPGKTYAPYLFDAMAVKQGAAKMGAEKIIYIDVLNKQPKLFSSKQGAVTGATYWYWNFVSQMTKLGHASFDKVIYVEVDSEILNFESTLDSVRKGQRAGLDLVEFLKEEYQY